MIFYLDALRLKIYVIKIIKSNTNENKFINKIKNFQQAIGLLNNLNLKMFLISSDVSFS